MRVCLVLEVDVANEVKFKQLVNELCIWMSRLTAKGLEKVDGVTVKMAQAIHFAFCNSWSVFQEIIIPIHGNWLLQKRTASRRVSLNQIQVDVSAAMTELWRRSVQLQRSRSRLTCSTQSFRSTLQLQRRFQQRSQTMRTTFLCPQGLRRALS